MECSYTWEGKKCRRTALGTNESGEPLCIFHLPFPHKEKKRPLFIKQLMCEFTNNDDWNMAGFIFPAVSYPKGEIPIPNAKTNIDLSEAVFTGEADFSEMDFNCETVFRNAHFKGNFKAEGCTFGIGLNEYHSHAFDQYPIDFTKAQFMGNVNFNKSIFIASTSFKEAHFYHTSSFNDECEFRESVDFGSAHFHKYTSFLTARFQRITSFSGCRFFNGVSFQSCFNGETYYDSAIFHQSPESRDCIAVFVNAVFSAQVHFADTQFHTRTFFNRVRFNSNADFERASFSEVDWKDCMCKGVLSLSEIRPAMNSMSIMNLKTHSGISIHVSPLDSEDGGTVEKDIHIKRCFIEGEFACMPYHSSIHLYRSTFLSDLRIDPTLDPDFDFDGDVSSIAYWTLFSDLCHFCSASTIAYAQVISLQGCHIDSELRLQDADMRKAKLDGTDLPKVRFVKATWNDIDRSKLGFGKLSQSKAIHDEYEHSRIRQLCWLKMKKRKKPGIKRALKKGELSKDDVHSIVLQYRGVSESYELRQDYENSAIFKAADLDVRRRSRRNSGRIERLALRTYRTVAAYGESISLPIAWFLILVLFFSWINLLVGFPINTEPLAVMNYDFKAPGQGLMKALEDFWSSIKFTFAYSLPATSSVESPGLSLGLRASLVGLRVFAGVVIAALVFAIRRKLIR